MHFQEVILCSTGSSSQNTGQGAITLHDFQTGSLLASFKQANADVHSTAVFQTGNGEGGYILCAQSDKSIMNVYYFQKDQIALKMVLPEKLTCIAIDRDSNYCAGGTALGRIYLWEIASGILFNVWDAHYRKVSVLRFTQDGAALISGSDDSGVSVWSVSSLLSNELQNEIPTPYCTLPDHTLAITDIVCGVGSFPSCRVLTASVDHSVKLWDLSSRSLLTTFLFPSPIHRLVFEIAERMFFASSSGDASNGGCVYQVKLYRTRDPQSGRIGVEAVGGGGPGDAVRLDSNSKGLISIGQQISSLALSLTQSTLLVGSSTGQVHVYDIASQQLLRTISPSKDKAQGLAVTHIECMLKPPDLIGHISFSVNVSGVSNARDVMPTRPVVPFQRFRDVKTREAHEVLMMIPAQDEPFYDPTIYSDEEILRDHASIIRPLSSRTDAIDLNGSQPTSQLSQQTRLAELESEVQRLRNQLAKAKGINDAMWEAVVQKVVGEKSTVA